MDIGKTRDLITAKLSSMHTRFARGETVNMDEFTALLDELRAAAAFLPLALVPASMGDLGGAAPRPPTPVDVTAARVEGAMHGGIIENRDVFRQGTMPAPARTPTPVQAPLPPRFEAPTSGPPGEAVRKPPAGRDPRVKKHR